jgi:hypothetical protein
MLDILVSEKLVVQKLGEKKKAEQTLKLTLSYTAFFLIILACSINPDCRPKKVLLQTRSANRANTVV